MEVYNLSKTAFKYLKQRSLSKCEIKLFKITFKSTNKAKVATVKCHSFGK